jgi:hypothetical protein
MSNNINYNSNNNFNKKKKFDYNKVLRNCTKGVKIDLLQNSSKSKIKNISEYEDSFSEIEPFKKKLTPTIKKSIDVVMYHDENNDGFLCGFLVWKYLIQNKKKDFILFPIKPSKSKFGVDRRISSQLEKFKDKTVIIMDVDLNIDTYKFFEENCKKFIVIDEHSNYQNKNIMDKYPLVFKGNQHASCAYVYKLFFPDDKKTNIFVMYVDSSDAKLFLPFLPFTNNFTKSIGIRFVHTKKYDSSQKKNLVEGGMFSEFDVFYEEDNINFWLFVGKYMEEYSEDIKFQIATNAQPAKFQGYKVGVLNFNAPELSKKVGRQIISNFKEPQFRRQLLYNNKFKENDIDIDFAVLWGWEYTSGLYRVQLIDDHRQTKISMKNIAEKLGQIAGTHKGGGGHLHVGNFYWPRNNKFDIWDLFEKNYL